MAKRKGAPKMNRALGGKLYAPVPRRTSGKPTKKGTFDQGPKSANSSNAGAQARDRKGRFT